MASISFKQELVESNTPEERGEEDWSLLKCVVCKVNFVKPTDKSYLLECLHAVCNSCLQSFVDNATNSEACPRECPGCKVAYHGSTFIENKFLNDLLITQDIPEDVDDLKCSNHPVVVATDWCDTCSAFICEVCVMAHKHLKPTKDHIIKSKAEHIEELKEKKPQRAFPCNEHPKEFLAVFCSSCNIMTCRDCQLAKHRLHDYSFLSEIANPTREALQNFKNEIETKRYQVDTQMITIKEIEAQIAQKKSRLLNEIKDIVLRLTEAIRKKGTDLMMQVDEICQAKVLEMTQKKDKLESNLRQMDHCTNFVRNALEIASDPVLVYSKEHIMNRLNHIRDSATSLQQLNVAFNMELHTPNIDEFVKALSRFAKVKSEPAAGADNSCSSENGSFTEEFPQQSVYQPQKSPQLPQQPQQVNIKPEFVTANHVLGGASQKSRTPWSAFKDGLGLSRSQDGQFYFGPAPQPIITPANTIHHRNLVTQQNYPGQPQPSNCAIVGGNPSGQDWVQSGGNWQSAHSAQSSNYRQPGPQPQGQNVIRVAANQQVTSTSNMYRPAQAATIFRMAPRPGGNRHPPSNSVNLMTMNRQLPPSMMPRLVVCRNYPTNSRSSPPWGGHPNNRNIAKMQQQQHQQLLQQQQQQKAAVPTGVLWHIPQTDNNQTSHPPVSPSFAKFPDPSFKILLTKSKTPPTVPTPTTVSSSAPETPPSSHPPNRPEVAEALDTLCQASLDDVLRTLSDLDKDTVDAAISKRDSVVHSSTGSTSNSESSTPQPQPAPQKIPGEWQKEDPNEDWCAVCMDGGELVCCDNCPKVFHINCHIPSLPRVPQELWQCTLCRDVSSLPYGGMKKHSRNGKLTEEEHSICERILLELYCQYDCSLHFREPVPPENVEYHKVIRKPMCFDAIRKRLTQSDPSHYCSLREFIGEIRLVFRNAFHFNPIGSQVYADGMTLEEFLESLLSKFLPLFAHTNLHDDLESEEEDGPIVPVKKLRRTLPD